ncbi:hypothetical protein OKW27_007715 [Paraburkholderia sp. 35.1]
MRAHHDEIGFAFAGDTAEHTRDVLAVRVDNSRQATHPTLLE